MKLSRRLKLYWRLMRLLPAAVRGVAVGTNTLEGRLFWSEVEACHRDLGHDFDPNVILREHEGPMA